MFLDVTRDGIHVASAYMTRRLAPGFKCRTGGGYSGINICAIGGGNLRQRFPSGGVDAVDILSTGGSYPLIIDKEAKGLALLNPLQGWSSRFGGRSILHGFK